MKFSLIKIAAIVSLTLVLASCSTFSDYNGRRGASSSLVDFLYPNGEKPSEVQATKPRLELPIKVGLAFVPSKINSRSALHATKKTELLESVRARFLELEYVDDITIVPEIYMARSKGFSGLNQVARLYDLDVIALVSYDQVSVTAERNSSLLYWTIVGAYVIKGNQNMASTFVDTAVFDVRSQKLLLRAPGVSEIEKSSTLVEVDTVHREISQRGFEVAMEDMTSNLEVELDRFKERISETDQVEIAHREGYGGGGAMGNSFWLLLLLLAGLRFRERKMPPL